MVPEAVAVGPGPATRGLRRRVVLLGWLLAPGGGAARSVDGDTVGARPLCIPPPHALAVPWVRMTRAVLALLRGEVRAALAYHPLSPLLVAVVGAWWVNNLLAASGRARLFRAPAHAGELVWVGIAVVLGVWLARLADYLPMPR